MARRTRPWRRRAESRRRVAREDGGRGGSTEGGGPERDMESGRTRRGRAPARATQGRSEVVGVSWAMPVGMEERGWGAMRCALLCTHTAHSLGGARGDR